MQVEVLSQRAFPLIELRLALAGGQAEDGDFPGSAALAAAVLRAGSKDSARSRIEAVGGKWGVLVREDALVVSIGVEASHVETALDAIGDMLTKPKVGAQPFVRALTAEREGALDREREDADWIARRVLQHELYESPVFVHPYAAYGATKKELARLGTGDYRRWCRRHLTAPGTTLVIAGDFEPAAMEQEIEKRFANLGGDAPEPAERRDPLFPARRALYFVERSGPAPTLHAGTFGPARSDPELEAVRVFLAALEIELESTLARHGLGPALTIEANLGSPLSGPAPLILRARAPSEAAGRVFVEILQRLDALSTAPPAARDLVTAARAIGSTAPLRFDTTRGAADAVLVQALEERFGGAVSEPTRGPLAPEMAAAIGARFFPKRSGIVVVVGDARSVRPLTRFGPVHVIESLESFIIKKTLPHDPFAGVDDS